MKEKWFGRGAVLASLLLSPAALADDDVADEASDPEELPPPAREELARRYPSAVLLRADYRDADGVGTTWDVSLVDGARRRVVAFDEHGAVLGERTPARRTDVPRVVRRALGRQVGRASLGRVERVTSETGSGWLLAFSHGDRRGVALVGDDGRLVRATLASA